MGLRRKRVSRRPLTALRLVQPSPAGRASGWRGCSGSSRCKSTAEARGRVRVGQGVSVRLVVPPDLECLALHRARKRGREREVEQDQVACVDARRSTLCIPPTRQQRPCRLAVSRTHPHKLTQHTASFPSRLGAVTAERRAAELRVCWPRAMRALHGMREALRMPALLERTGLSRPPYLCVAAVPSPSPSTLLSATMTCARCRPTQPTGALKPHR